MEKLSEEQRTSVSKMSVERLHGKLVKAGYKQEDVEGLGRPDLLDLYVQILLTETAYVLPKDLEIEEYGEGAEGGVELPGREQTATTNAGDRALEFEERRLWLEERKLEEQKRQRLLEERKLKMQEQLEEKKLIIWLQMKGLK